MALRPFGCIDELLREFAVHMIDTMWEGKDHRPRLEAKNRLFRERLRELGFAEIIMTDAGYEAVSSDALRSAFLSYADCVD